MSSTNNNAPHENRSEDEIKTSREILDVMKYCISSNDETLVEQWTGTTDRVRQADIIATMLISDPDKLEAMLVGSSPWIKVAGQWTKVDTPGPRPSRPKDFLRPL